ncbi:uncharacterized protein [Procambarus clarkii]|uniref:uncharacterized protein n=1 Tax=Procambarus clarkii TaxID=6728 RepID=UPI00374292D8
MQREHDKKQADSVLEYRRQELNLETTHHTQRQQATASLPVSFNVSQTKLVNLILVEEFFRRAPPSIRLYLADKEETDLIKCAKSPDTYSLIHRSLPNDSLGVSPYEILYGRKYRTPLKAFKDSLRNATFSDPQLVPHLTKRAKEISAFTTPFGLYRYELFPFGLCNAPATFQRAVNRVIYGLDHTYAYLDDIIMAQFSNQRLLHLALYLQNFNLEIFFIKGSYNIIAYFLSRVYEVETATPTSLLSTEDIYYKTS